MLSLSFIVGLILGLFFKEIISHSKSIKKIYGYYLCEPIFKKYGKISAIKKHREIFNSTLKDAKEEIEKWFNC